MNRRRFLLILSVLSLLAGCATGTLSLQTNPEKADVYLIEPGGKATKFGQTPLDIDARRLFRGGQDFAQLIVKSQGYESKRLVFPKTFVESSHQIRMTLAEQSGAPGLGAKGEIKDLASCEAISHESLNKLSKGIAACQAFLLRGDYEVAKTKLSQLIADFPNVSVLYDLQGNAFYLQKSYDQALAAYEKSLSIDPQNLETANMVRKLREITGKSSGG
jgi:tetratricopeptide (TPR) repeat protein